MRRMEKETDWLSVFKASSWTRQKERERLADYWFQSLIMEETEERLIISLQSLVVDETEGERDRLVTGFQSLIMEKTEETDYQFSKPCHGGDRRKRLVDYWLSKPCDGEDRSESDWLSVFRASSWRRQKRDWLSVFKASSWRRQKKEMDWLSCSKASSWTRQKEKETDYWFFKASTSTQVISGEKKGVKHSPHTRRRGKKSLPRRHHGDTHTTLGKCWRQWCGRSPRRWCRPPPHGQRSGTPVAASSAVPHRGASSAGDKTHTVYTCSLLFPWQQLASQQFF